MFPDGLQSAEGPAETLANELAWSFRSLGPGDGFFVVADAPTASANGDGEVGVFGDRVGGDAADGFDGRFAPGPESPGNDGDAVEEIKGALFHVLASDVFKSLPASEPAAAIANFHVTGDCGDFGIRKMADQLGKGVRFNLSVGVDGDDDFGLRLGHGATESSGFSGVGLMNKQDARIAGKVLVEKGASGVGGTVVDDDNVEVLSIGS